jgi:hypothetical protein
MGSARSVESEKSAPSNAQTNGVQKSNMIEIKSNPPPSYKAYVVNLGLHKKMGPWF